MYLSYLRKLQVKKYMFKENNEQRKYNVMERELEKVFTN